MEKKEIIENVTSLNHNLNNIVGIIEASMNLLNNADTDTLGKRWIAMRDTLIATGRDRMNKEINSFQNVKKSVESVSIEIYMDTSSKFPNADKYYKAMFDILTNSKEYSDEAKNASFVYGNKIVCLLKSIINSLEVIRIESQKI